MFMRSGSAAIRVLILMIGVLGASCSPQSGVDLLGRTAANTGEALCRQAGNCYPACDPEEATHCSP